MEILELKNIQESVNKKTDEQKLPSLKDRRHGGEHSLRDPGTISKGLTDVPQP